MLARRSTIVLVMVALLTSVLTWGGTSTAVSTPAAAKSLAAARVVGQPPLDFVIPPNSYFSFPNRTKGDRYAIRDRVLKTIRSTWGGPKAGVNLASNGNGTIRIATWSFQDWGIARALVEARDRGVSVQVMAAKTANEDHDAWIWLKKKLGGSPYAAAAPTTTRELISFARECEGSCRGFGGTAHAKYFLFDNVGYKHVRNVVVQASMNLTTFAVEGQWNQAEVQWSPQIWNQYMAVFRETRNNKAIFPSYRGFVSNNITSLFFPLQNGNANRDPVMGMLNQTTCTGAQVGTKAGRTVIRIAQYSIYSDRGVWLAKRLRALWNAGCDIRIIYSVSSRPVLQILRNTSGRGAIPMRQSVITNTKREIVKYNHSKWMTIMGNYAGNPRNYVTMAGSSNWSSFSFAGDEQVQIINSQGQVGRHNNIFNITWNQSSSHLPGYGTQAAEARMSEQARIAAVPQEPTWGKGMYKYLSPNGD